MAPPLAQRLREWYLSLHDWLQPLNNSKFFAGLIVVLLNLGSKLVDVRLSKPMQSFFKNSFSRQVLLFAMIWMPTRDVLTALVVSTLIIFGIDCLANDESSLCVLPRSFTQHHRQLLEVEAMTAAGGGGTAGTTGTTGTTGAAAGPRADAPLEDSIDAAIRALEQARTALRATAAATTAKPKPAAAPEKPADGGYHPWSN